MDFPTVRNVHPLAVIDPIHHLFHRNFGGEFVARFEVLESQTMVHILGFENAIPLERKGVLRLRICTGLCGRLKDSQIASGFSIVRLRAQNE